MPDPDADPTRARRVASLGAVVNGALAGLFVLLPVSVANALADHNVDDWDDSAFQAVLVVGIFAGYFVAGGVAGRLAPGAPLANGILAGIGSVVCWLPVRVAIWLVRSDDRGLLTGDRAVFTVGSLFGHLVLATGFGALGGLLGARQAARLGPFRGR